MEFDSSDTYKETSKKSDPVRNGGFRMGLAKEYDVYGSVKRKITWTKGKKSIKETEGW